MLERRRAMIVAAHPDDETIGLGGSMRLLAETLFVHLTDGAPRDMRDATAHGFRSREAYAEARRREFHEALRAGDVKPAETICLACADQEASLHLPEIAAGLERLLRRWRVEILLVHPYEGGHPDHDAAAFAARTAVQLLPIEYRPALVEFTSYHNCGGQMETGRFLPDGQALETTFRLDALQRARKQHMLECFQTQRAVLAHFGAEVERFRPAPDYDFSRPPHPGRLYYEQFPWGMTADRWLSLAHAAREALGLC